MPSTDETRSLSISYRRAEVAGFWLLIGLLAWACVALVAAGAAAPRPWVWGSGAALILLLPAAVWPPWLHAGVRVWNGLTRRCAAVLRRYVLAVCYYTLFAAAGRAGSALALVPPLPDRSGWTPRPTHAGGGRTSWDHGLLAFTRTPEHRWALSLLPAMFLLRLLRDEQQERAVPGSTYTLY